MSSRLRAIFFDAGNTLVFPRVEAIAADLAAQGFPATVEDFSAAERAGKTRLDEWLWPQIRKLAAPVSRQVDLFYWEHYLAALMDRIRAPENERKRLSLRVAEGFRDITLWSKVFPETSPCLEALRAQGYFLGVISNSNGTIDEQLERVGLAPYFDAILDSGRVGVEKPHPEIFRLGLARARVPASEALFVGDSCATDIGGAQLAGLRGVLLDRVDAYPAAEVPRISALGELAQVLENLRG